MDQRKAESRLPIVRKKESQSDSFYSQIIDIPKRPAWTYDMTKEQVEGQEAEMFEKYLDGIYERFPIRRLNYFEHNLEVWRQLWRVCEVSDALLILADIRHPMFHFPPALYHYVVRDMKKPMILVLTKVDLVPTSNVVKWTQYFTDTFPGLFVCSYTSYERRSEDDEDSWSIGTKKKSTRRRGKSYFPTGVEAIMDIIRSFKIAKKGKIVPVDYVPPNAQPAIVSLEKVSSSPSTENSSDTKTEEVSKESSNDKNTSSGAKNGGKDSKNNSDFNQNRNINAEDEDEALSKEDNDEDDEDLEDGDREEELKRIEEAMNEDHYQPVREVDHIVLGLIGNPNVGKSTFINAMKGRKVCSTSRTPGHTKWKQTIFLNKDLMLVDCPGLVFPAVDMPKQLQILCGIFPIAQVREPFSAIQYMAKFVPIEQVYRLSISDARDSIKYDPSKGEIEWSAWMICEAYAEKRGYHTRRGVDVHRAGLEILFDIIDGRVVLYFLPNQTTLNLGAFTDPDGKLCRPLAPRDPNETPLPDLSTVSVSHSSQTKRRDAQTGEVDANERVIVVPNRPSASNDDNNVEEDDEEFEESGENEYSDSEDLGDSKGSEDNNLQPIAPASNPWDILGSSGTMPK